MRRGRPSQRPDAFRLDRGAPLSRGMLGAWLGQHAGASLYHDAGEHRHGTLTGFTGAGNTPADRWAFSSTLGRRSLTFDGSGTYVPSLLPALTSTPAVTVAAWVNATSVAATRYAISDYNFGTICTVGLAVNSAAKWIANVFDSVAVTGPTATAGRWTHLAMTRGSLSASTSVTLWVDGVAYTGTAGTAVGGDTFTVGRPGGLASFYWSGQIADPAAWSRVLSPAEITALADPANVDLRVGGVPLVRPIRRFFAVPPVPPIGATLGATATAAATSLAGTVAVRGTLAAVDDAATTSLGVGLTITAAAAMAADAASVSLAGTMLTTQMTAAADAASTGLTGFAGILATFEAVAAPAAVAFRVAWPRIPAANDRRDLLQWGLAAMTDVLDRTATQPILYVADTDEIPARATFAPKLLKIDDGQGGTRVEWTDMDFLIPARYLVVAGEPIEPSRGHLVYLRAGDVVQKFEVLPYGDEPPWRWSDPHRSMVRVHTKRLADDPAIT